MSPEVTSALSEDDARLRTALAREIARTGYEPTLEELAVLVGRAPPEVASSLERLQANHALLLHPHQCRPWVVHPFALYPAACWVQGESKGWWAACVYCAFGIGACVQEDVTITTRYGGEAETVVYRIAKGVLQGTADVFHFATPPAQWWDNVIHACATFLPFRDEAEVGRWCERHRIRPGSTIPVATLWRFATDWYGHYTESWRLRSSSEIGAIFRRHGLTGPFWNPP